MSVIEKSANAFFTGSMTLRLIDAKARNHPKNRTISVTLKWSTFTNPMMRFMVLLSFAVCIVKDCLMKLLFCKSNKYMSNIGFLYVPKLGQLLQKRNTSV